MRKCDNVKYFPLSQSDLHYLENLLSLDENWAILRYVFYNHDDVNELYLPVIAREFGSGNEEMAKRMQPLVRHGLVYQKVNTKTDLGNYEKYIYSPAPKGKSIMKIENDTELMGKDNKRIQEYSLR